MLYVQEEHKVRNQFRLWTQFYGYLAQTMSSEEHPELYELNDKLFVAFNHLGDYIEQET